MANRVIRDWTTSEKIDALSEGAELFFVRLIMKADDHGCFHANPKLLKAALFPLKDYNVSVIEEWTRELEENGVIITYESEGRKYLKINEFGQRLRNMVSKFPQPADNPPTNDRKAPPETKRNEVETEVETKTFDYVFLEAFDEVTCEGFKMTFRDMDLRAELQRFRLKCDNDKAKYYHRDAAGLRTAFQYQLNNSRNGRKKDNSIIEGFAERVKQRNKGG